MMKTIKQASEETGLSYHCIRKLFLSGEIKGRRSGKKIYIYMPSLIAWCEGGDPD